MFRQFYWLLQRPESKLHVKMLRAILALEDAGYIYIYVLDLHTHTVYVSQKKICIPGL